MKNHSNYTPVHPRDSFGAKCREHRVDSLVSKGFFSSLSLQYEDIAVHSHQCPGYSTKKLDTIQKNSTKREYKEMLISGELN